MMVRGMSEDLFFLDNQPKFGVFLGTINGGSGEDRERYALESMNSVE